MAFSAILKVLPLTLLLAFCQGAGQDATLQPGAFGAGIVNAVVDKIRANCIFSEDRLFLRRTAYVMSRDGSDTTTYRAGFDGGIWQITEDMFLKTKNCNLAPIKAACGSITAQLNISWPSVQWTQLRQPLYSGLSATLVTLMTLQGSAMAGDVSSQADLWSTMYEEDDDATFVDAVAQAPSFECKDQLDLVFILDSSGSVSSSSYLLMKKFAASVVDAMNISLDAIRIADIVYSSSVQVYFDFDAYTDRSSVKTQLLATPKFSQGTNTADALDKAAEILYDYSGSGARENVKKVAVLITDGMSNDFSRTIASAANLKNKGTTVFALGVGGYRLSELIASASDPTCSHVLTLTGFDKIQSIVTEIQKSTCQASYTLSESNTIEGNLTEDTTEVNAGTTVPSPNHTIVARVSCGILHIYVSTTDPRPGPTVFQKLYTATPDAPAELRVVETLPQGTPVYITVMGTRLPPTVTALRNCSDYSYSLGVEVKTVVKVVCEENGKRRSCTRGDVTEAGLCPNNQDLPLENPCTPQNLDKGVMRHPYLYDPTKFLQCDLKGQYYITLCPGGVIFNVETTECGFSSPGSSNTQPIDTGGKGEGEKNASIHGPVPTVPSVTLDASAACRSQTVRKQQFYHAYPADKAKFIQCDNWGNGYLMSCGPGTEWSQSAYTCVHAN